MPADYSESTPSMSNSASKRLERLVGKWNAEVLFPSFSPTPMHTVAIFEWVEDRSFLAWRADAPSDIFPSAVFLIGADDSIDRYTALYSDSRGVSRIYDMSLSDDGVWKLWRNDPGFSQRFTGRFSEDGNIIAAAWETSQDDSTWKLDFNVTYTRIQ
jgi:hypothetical protein